MAEDSPHITLLQRITTYSRSLGAGAGVRVCVRACVRGCVRACARGWVARLVGGWVFTPSVCLLYVTRPRPKRCISVKRTLSRHTKFAARFATVKTKDRFCHRWGSTMGKLALSQQFHDSAAEGYPLLVSPSLDCRVTVKNLF